MWSVNYPFIVIIIIQSFPFSYISCPIKSREPSAIHSEEKKDICINMNMKRK